MKRSKPIRIITGLVAFSMTAGIAAADWVEFVDETSSRIVAAPSVGVADSAERDYEWADVNNDGWIDLVVMRKLAANSINAFRTNVLFMNEGGVLVDRTAEYASAVAMDQLPTGTADEGFLTPTIDRDVVIVDVDGDGWLDLVTSPSLSHGQPKHISHPRVYMNLGNNEKGEWQGFEFQNDRIPQLAGYVNGGPWDGTPHAPRFCGVAAGDVNGDGHPDLYFNDYSSTCSGCPNESLDFEDRLLINDGNGYFTDETSARLPFGFYESNMGVHPIIADFNGNGSNDILKMSTLGGCCPYAAYMIYNTNHNGNFLGNSWHIPNGAGGSPYFVEAADLNNDGRLDLVIADDGTDRFTRNLGTNSNGMVNWSSSTSLPNSGGFRSNVVPADLNNDGFVDLLTASVDFDLYGWNRLSGFHRSNANPNNIGFSWDSGNIPQSKLYGGYDFATFDINNDGWLDIVFARGDNSGSGETIVWMNQPTFGVNFSYPDDRPSIVEPEEDITLLIQAQPFGSTVEEISLCDASNPDNCDSIGATYEQVNSDTYEFTIPGVECGDQIAYYVQVRMTNDNVVTDPSAPELNHYTIYAASDLITRFEDDMGPPAPDTGWTIDSDDSLVGGEWEAAVPNPTLFGPNLASPDGDASGDEGGMAFITENCDAPFAPPGSCDVEGGPTFLILPLDDVQSVNAQVTYDRWFFTSGVDNRQRELETYVSNDGGTSWTLVDTITGTGGEWETVSFIIADYVEPTDQMAIRFATSDEDDQTVTNAAIDNVTVSELSCGGPACTGDLNGDDVVNGSDLLLVLGDWGECAGCDSDLNGDDTVNGGDLLILLSGWGDCP